MANKNEVMAALKQGKNLHLLQRILRSLDLPTGTSWVTVEKNLDAALSGNAAVLDNIIEAIKLDALIDKKAISYVILDDSKLAAAVSAIKKVNVTANPLKKFFPINADPATLQADDGRLKVVHTFSDATGHGVVLSRKREFSIRETLDRNQFNTAMQLQFPDYEKIIALKYHRAQTYDVIYVNTKHKLIELRADATLHENKTQNNGQMETSVGDLLYYAKSSIFMGLGFDISKDILNLFPLIKKLYDSNTGRVKRLGFSTATESIKRETVNGDDDLRHESFHSAGSAAIANMIAPYEITMDWKRAVSPTESSRPQLTIPGTYSNSIKANARSNYAILKGMRDAGDIDFLTTILISMK